MPKLVGAPLTVAGARLGFPGYLGPGRSSLPADEYHVVTDWQWSGDKAYEVFGLAAADPDAGSITPALAGVYAMEAVVSVQYSSTDNNDGGRRAYGQLTLAVNGEAGPEAVDDPWTTAIGALLEDQILPAETPEPSAALNTGGILRARWVQRLDAGDVVRAVATMGLLGTPPEGTVTFSMWGMVLDVHRIG